MRSTKQLLSRGNHHVEIVHRSTFFRNRDVYCICQLPSAHPLRNGKGFREALQFGKRRCIARVVRSRRRLRPCCGCAIEYARANQRGSATVHGRQASYQGNRPPGLPRPGYGHHRFRLDDGRQWPGWETHLARWDWCRCGSEASRWYLALYH